MPLSPSSLEFHHSRAKKELRRSTSRLAQHDRVLAVGAMLQFTRAIEAVAGPESR